MIPVLVGPTGESTNEGVTYLDQIHNPPAPPAQAPADDAHRFGYFGDDDQWIPSTADPAELADHLGYTVGNSEPTAEDLANAAVSLGDIRADVRREAARIVSDTTRQLDLLDVGGRGGIANPSDTPADWWATISRDEHARLRRNGWFAPRGSHRGTGYDEIVEKYFTQVDPGVEQIQDGSAQAMQWWVAQTRIVDVARALSHGRATNPRLYGGLSANDIIDSPYDLGTLFAAKDQAIAEVARVYATEATNDAALALGSPVGAAPWEMTEQAYMDETARLEARAQTITPIDPGDEWLSPRYDPADAAVLARLHDLLPESVNDPNLSLPAIYRTILRVARAGGLLPPAGLVP